MPFGLTLAVQLHGKRQSPTGERKSAERQGSPVIDSHCHLADSAFEPDLPEVVSRAVSGGVTQALCILTAGEEEEADRGRRVEAPSEEEGGIIAQRSSDVKRIVSGLRILVRGSLNEWDAAPGLTPVPGVGAEAG